MKKVWSLWFSENRRVSFKWYSLSEYRNGILLLVCCERTTCCCLVTSGIHPFIENCYKPEVIIYWCHSCIILCEFLLYLKKITNSVFRFTYINYFYRKFWSFFSMYLFLLSVTILLLNVCGSYLMNKNCKLYIRICYK